MSQELTPQQRFETRMSGRHYSLQTYKYHLDRFREYCDVKSINDLVNLDPQKIEDKITLYIKRMEERDALRSTRNVAISAIIKFYEINKVNLNWKSLRDILGADDSTRQNQSYSANQIASILKYPHASKRLKAAVAVMAKSGVRAGCVGLEDLSLFYNKDFDEKHPLDILKIGDIQYSSELKMFTLFPYNGQGKFKYITFVDPQGSVFLADYLRTRKNLKPSDWLFCSSRDPDVPYSKDSLYYELSTVLEDLKIRRPLENKFQRHKTPLCNGFREFFFTALLNTPRIPAIRSFYMKGEKRKLAQGIESPTLRNYYTPTVEELLRGKKESPGGYLHAIKNLTLPL